MIYAFHLALTPLPSSSESASTLYPPHSLKAIERQCRTHMSSPVANACQPPTYLQLLQLYASIYHLALPPIPINHLPSPLHHAVKSPGQHLPAYVLLFSAAAPSPSRQASAQHLRHNSALHALSCSLTRCLEAGIPLTSHYISLTEVMMP